LAAAEVENFRQTETVELVGVPVWYPALVSGGNDAAVHPGQDEGQNVPQVSQKKCFVILRVQCASAGP
jgi:hypothetical protein